MSEQKPLADLERELVQANERAESAWVSLSDSFSNSGPQWDEYMVANRNVLAAERRLAAAKKRNMLSPSIFRSLGTLVPHVRIC